MLILDLVLALAGLGLLKAFLESWTNWSEPTQWTATCGVVGILTIISYVYQAYPTWPRHLKHWQREAILAHCPSVKPVPGRLTYMLGYPRDALQTEDYARELMSVFGDRGCNLSIAFGDDPYPNDVIFNDKQVIVPPDNNLLLRIVGLQLWVLNPANPPIAAKQLAKTLDAAGIAFMWKPDIRLGGTAVEGDYRFPVSEPDCVLLVGSKPPWSFHAW